MELPDNVSFEVMKLQDAMNEICAQLEEAERNGKGVAALRNKKDEIFARLQAIQNAV